MSGSVERTSLASGPPHETGKATTPTRALGELVTAADGDRPAVTMVARSTGERTELGCATLSNWADKTANLLVEELEVDAGEEVGVDLGSHWTTLVVLLGAWRAGIVVRLGEADPEFGPAVVHEHRVGGMPVDDDVVVVGAGMAGRQVGDVHGGLSFATDVLSMPDEFSPVRLADGHPALRVSDRTVSQDALAGGAQAAAELMGLQPRLRLASARRVDRLDGLVVGPLAAWEAGASLVLVTEPASLADVVASERADVALDLERDDQPGLDVRGELAEDGSVLVRRA